LSGIQVIRRLAFVQREHVDFKVDHFTIGTFLNKSVKLLAQVAAKNRALRREIPDKGESFTPPLAFFEP
jgi:hypothetical protein